MGADTDQPGWPLIKEQTIICNSSLGPGRGLSLFNAVYIKSIRHRTSRVRRFWSFAVRCPTSTLL